MENNFGNRLHGLRDKDVFQGIIGSINEGILDILWRQDRRVVYFILDTGVDMVSVGNKGYRTRFMDDGHCEIISSKESEGSKI